MAESGRLANEQAEFVVLLERQRAERVEASSRRRKAIIEEHVTNGRSYADIADELNLDRSRVIQIVKGRDR